MQKFSPIHDLNPTELKVLHDVIDRTYQTIGGELIRNSPVECTIVAEVCLDCNRYLRYTKFDEELFMTSAMVKLRQMGWESPKWNQVFNQIFENKMFD